MRISDWSSDVCSSDLTAAVRERRSLASWMDGATVHKVARRRRIHSNRAAGAGCEQNVRRGTDPASPGSGGDAGLGGLAVGVVRRAHQRAGGDVRSEEHTSELPSLMRISYAAFCLK